MNQLTPSPLTHPLNFNLCLVVYVEPTKLFESIWGIQEDKHLKKLLWSIYRLVIVGSLFAHPLTGRLSVPTIIKQRLSRVERLELEQPVKSCGAIGAN